MQQEHFRCRDCERVIDDPPAVPVKCECGGTIHRYVRAAEARKATVRGENADGPPREALLIHGALAERVLEELGDYHGILRLNDLEEDAERVGRVESLFFGACDSAWEDCPECGWVGTLAVNGEMVCTSCRYRESITGEE